MGNPQNHGFQYQNGKLQVYKRNDLMQILTFAYHGKNFLRSKPMSFENTCEENERLDPCQAAHLPTLLQLFWAAPVLFASGEIAYGRMPVPRRLARRLARKKCEVPYITTYNNPIIKLVPTNQTSPASRFSSGRP